MRVLLRKFLRREYRPLNNIHIVRENLIGNYHYLNSLRSGTSIVPVLKSNAYGHGLVNIGRISDELRPPFICVDSLFEAYELDKAGIKTPLLIMGYVNPHNLKVKRLPFAYAVWDLETAQAISKYQPLAEIHIFVDTGMNREGIPLPQLPGLIRGLAKTKSLNIAGLMSHLAMGDQPGNPLTRKQYDRFITARKMLHDHAVEPRWMHIDASAGHLYGLGDGIGNISRCGLALYGLDPTGKDNKRLKQVIRLNSTLIQVKQVAAGDKIGYDFTFSAQKKMILGVLPLGYSDGLDRRLSNKGIVTIKGVNCPVVGRVSMNVTAIDITEIDQPYAGMEAVIISGNPLTKNCLQTIAKKCNTIPYDILVGLNPSIRRTVT